MVTSQWLVKVCLLQALLLGMMTWQLIDARNRQIDMDQKRMALCTEISKALPKIDCTVLDKE